MREIELKAIEIFERKNANFKKGLAREFQKQDPLNANLDMYKYRNILIYSIYEEITLSDDAPLNAIENLFEVIENALFNHINQNYNYENTTKENKV